MKLLAEDLKQFYDVIKKKNLLSLRSLCLAAVDRDLPSLAFHKRGLWKDRDNFPKIWEEDQSILALLH